MTACVPPFARPLHVVGGCGDCRCDDLIAALVTVQNYVEATTAHRSYPCQMRYEEKGRAYAVMVKALADYAEAQS